MSVSMENYLLKRQIFTRCWMSCVLAMVGYTLDSACSAHINCRDVHPLDTPHGMSTHEARGDALPPEERLLPRREGQRLLHHRNTAPRLPARAVYPGTSVRCVFISQKVFIKSFCRSPFPHIPVNFLFLSVIITDKLTDLQGN